MGILFWQDLADLTENVYSHKIRVRHSAIFLCGSPWSRSWHRSNTSSERRDDSSTDRPSYGVPLTKKRTDPPAVRRALTDTLIECQKKHNGQDPQLRTQHGPASFTSLVHAGRHPVGHRRP